MKNLESIDLEKLAKNLKIRMTPQRRAIINILIASEDHPTVEDIYYRIQKINPEIGIATVYRNVALLEKYGVIYKLEIDYQNKSRYEIADIYSMHEHLIDSDTGEIIEFSLKKDEIEEIYKKIGDKLGYNVIHHKLQLFGRKKNRLFSHKKNVFVRNK
ncbi:Fur family transcriptional regulator [Lyticum sinuosum]|uniref:Ferric uptake regulation protein n=1 Tax=Lyticum sinuosum TaxID=1332059 RepID=A0AAE5AHP7_9RICK|nr:Fur family transcriptional regulator [Lyticum sinuosum]MDZ5761373.1 putative transcriptional repressor [Lyticum sinuosum]